VFIVTFNKLLALADTQPTS